MECALIESPLYFPGDSVWHKCRVQSSRTEWNFRGLLVTVLRISCHTAVIVPTLEHVKWPLKVKDQRPRKEDSRGAYLILPRSCRNSTVINCSVTCTAVHHRMMLQHCTMSGVTYTLQVMTPRSWLPISGQLPSYQRQRHARLRAMMSSNSLVRWLTHVPALFFSGQNLFNSIY